MAIARKALLFGPSRSMHSRSAAPNGHGVASRGPKLVLITRPIKDRLQEGGAIAAKAGLATDLLFAVAQDTAANAADRRKAASQIAEFFLPKNARGKKPRRGKFPPDEYGFVVDPELARELRDSKLKLACLKLDKKRTPLRDCARGEESSGPNRGDPEIHSNVPVLQDTAVSNSRATMSGLRSLLIGGYKETLFPPEEDLEEARRTARRDSFLKGPEVMARQRLKDLRDKKRVAENGWPAPHCGARNHVPIFGPSVSCSSAPESQRRNDRTAPV